MLLETLGRDYVEAFEVPFLEDVLSVLNSMSGGKALGLDSFTMAFWQHYWEFVRLEAMNFFKVFYEFGSFERSLNVTFLVFISLASCLYKLTC